VSAQFPTIEQFQALAELESETHVTANAEQPASPHLKNPEAAKHLRARPDSPLSWTQPEHGGRAPAGRSTK
jgi:hypothetical protein